jgi:hypothetical protein
VRRRVWQGAAICVAPPRMRSFAKSYRSLALRNRCRRGAAIVPE